MGHQVEDFLTLVTHQGQLVEGGLGRWRIVAFDLVFDGFDQGVFGELFFVDIDIVLARSWQAPQGKTASLPAFSAVMLLARSAQAFYNWRANPLHGLEAM